MNHYELLGVRIDATPMEIEAAYQTLKNSSVFNKDPIMELELGMAYQILISPYDRLQYDKECGIPRRIPDASETPDGRKVGMVVYDKEEAKESQQGYQERMQMQMPVQVNHNYYQNHRTTHHAPDYIQNPYGYGQVHQGMLGALSLCMYFTIGFSVITCIGAMFF